MYDVKETIAQARQSEPDERLPDIELFARITILADNPGDLSAPPEVLPDCFGAASSDKK